MFLTGSFASSLINFVRHILISISFLVQFFEIYACFLSSFSLVLFSASVKCDGNIVKKM